MSQKNKHKPAVTALKDAGVKKTHSPHMEPIPILQAPARDGFDIARWRTAIKQAEDPKEPDRTLLYDIYNDIQCDSHLTAVLEKRIEYIRGDVSDWATFNELYASPFRVGTYPAFNQAVKNELEAAVKNSYARAYAILPEGTKLEFIQNSGTGSSSSAYNALADFCDKQLSKLFLHSTMTTDAEGGEYKGDVHERSEQGVHKSDRRFVQNVLNSRLTVLLERHGFNPGTGRFVFPEEDHICLKDRLDMDLKLSEKIIIPDEYWYERYNLPTPKGGPKAKQPETNRPGFREDTPRGFFG